MVNSLQIIVLGVFFALMQPPNTRVIQIELLKSCSFDLFQTEVWYSEIFSFGDTESFSELFEESGIEGSNFIISIGPVFIFVVLFPLYMLIHSCMKWLFKDEQKIKCIKDFIEPKGFFVIAMVFMLEGCVELGISVGVSMKKLNSDRFSNGSEILSSLLAFFFMVMLVLAPIYSMVAGIRLYRAKKRGDEETVEKYEAIFEGKRMESSGAIQYSTLFFARRYALMAAIVFSPDSRNTHIFMMVLFTVFVLGFIKHVRPFEDNGMNKQEFYNELTVLFANYMLFLFTEFVPMQEDRYMIGWV